MQAEFTDADIINRDEFPELPGCETNIAWLFHDAGFVLAVVFAQTFQDALEIAAAKSKLDRFKVAEPDLAEYGPAGDGLDFLGNPSEPFDLENLLSTTLPTTKFSFAANKQERQPARPEGQ